MNQVRVAVLSDFVHLVDEFGANAEEILLEHGFRPIHQKRCSG